MKYKLTKINKIEKIDSNNSTVYDLTIKNNHSYVANNIIVHNCLTTQQTGIGFPMASLIRECYLIKEEYEKKLKNEGNIPKIVADGGMKDYADIVKALALGADYVMIGSIFNKALESAGDNYFWKFKISNKIAKFLYENNIPIKKKFYGMSTKIAQKKLGNINYKTSEGVVRYRNVEYTLKGWVENFEHYLRSAMSYSNANVLNEFIGKVNFNLITQNSFQRFNK